MSFHIIDIKKLEAKGIFRTLFLYYPMHLQYDCKSRYHPSTCNNSKSLN